MVKKRYSRVGIVIACILVGGTLYCVGPMLYFVFWYLMAAMSR